MLQPEPTQGDASWFVHDRFGMFIHWDPYALPARHEWVASYERIADEDYRVYFDHFNPNLYDPKVWAAAAKAAGMKYVVLTAKHHEGFCLWDSRQTDYKVTNTPYGRDLLEPYVAAFREAGLRVGFYYLLIDWHHADFPIDIFHPYRDRSDEELSLPGSTQGATSAATRPTCANRSASSSLCISPTSSGTTSPTPSVRIEASPARVTRSGRATNYSP